MCHDIDRGACVAVSGVRDESVRSATEALAPCAERAIESLKTAIK